MNKRKCLFGGGTSGSGHLTYIDIAKGIGIILMVVGHSSAPKNITHCIYIFHMPLFFIISGYLFNFFKWSNNFKGFINKRFDRMIIPYFGMSILVFYPMWYIASMKFSQFATHEIPTPQKTFLDIFYATFVGDGMTFNPVLWFLPCLFVSEIIFFVLLTLCKTTKMQILCSISIAIVGYLLRSFNLPWSIDIAMVVQVLLMSGYLLKKIDIKMWLIAISMIIFMLSNAFNSVDTSHRIYGNLFLYYAGGISGTILILKLSDLLDVSMKKTLGKLLAYCGKESMSILMWHGWGLKIATLLMAILIGKNFLNTKYLLWPMLVIISILFSITILYVKNKFLKTISKNNNLNIVKIITKIFAW